MEIKIIRSQRRQKTVSAKLVDDVLEVRAPAHLPDAELAPIIEQLKNRLERRQQANELNADGELAVRAQHLNRRYFRGRLRINSIKYVTNQHKRFGSCTVNTATIRISDRIASLPAWVRDSVIIHELAHLKEPNHSPRFWQLVNRYKLAERARGYLMAIGMEEDTVDDQQ